MENVLKTSANLNKHYEDLPDASYPKSEFLLNVAHRCKVSTATVRNWIKYGMKPNNAKHVDILSEITGIPKELLFKK